MSFSKRLRAATLRAPRVEAMEFNPLFPLEFVVFSGAALAWATWEYFSARPDKKKPTDSADEAGHPEG